MADYMPIILIGGLAVGGFLLYQSGALSNLFQAPAPPAVAAPVSGASTTATTPPASTAGSTYMGTDYLTGQPCPCPSASSPYPSTAAAAYVFPPQIKNPRQRHGSKVIGILGAGGLPSLSSTCNCTGAPGASPYPYGGVAPSQYSTGGDLNNYIGSSIAQAGYRMR